MCRYLTEFRATYSRERLTRGTANDDVKEILMRMLGEVAHQLFRLQLQDVPCLRMVSDNFFRYATTKVLSGGTVPLVDPVVTAPLTLNPARSNPSEIPPHPAKRSSTRGADPDLIRAIFVSITLAEVISSEAVSFTWIIRGNRHS